jgi:hypothetical protein
MRMIHFSNARQQYSRCYDRGHCVVRLEGIVSKNQNSPYRSGPSQRWIKVKTSLWREANRECWKLFERQT